jgi:hypothetical protein
MPTISTTAGRYACLLFATLLLLVLRLALTQGEQFTRRAGLSATPFGDRDEVREGN